ncbi:hypothetical protein OX283_006065 [Flavobacterium sp. SUN052]|uniref:hypothetical protein n=1 Tax=Flavobacterium sp. SUN052 TaxID=3002441 RepID=UPI00237E206B|nr:hypothetical protein [Flavobacterium sp. SUN052]MEC4004212.1 hypothetical protein [Flavobacterium sp. SUN052]
MKPTFLIFILTLFLSGCSNDSSTKEPNLTLPPETQVGANTFGCYINGKLLVPRGFGLYNGDYPALILAGYPSESYSEIDIRDYKSKNASRIFIHIQSLVQNGESLYNIDESNGQTDIDGLNHTYVNCKIFNEDTNSYQYYRSFDNSGTLKITKYDFIPSVKLILSGTFNCKLRNSINPNDIIEVTQGRFDFNGATLHSTNFP